MKSKRRVKAAVPSEVGNGEGVDMEDDGVLEEGSDGGSTTSGGLYCRGCRNYYKSEWTLSQHKCGGVKASLRQVVVVRRACELSAHYLVDVRTVTSAMSTFKCNDSYRVGDGVFPKGWARRSPHGKVYGGNYIQRFREDVRDMFLAGNKGSRKKKSASAMRKALGAKYPEKTFLLPSEAEVRTEINSLSMKMKKAVTNKAGGEEDAADE